MTFEEADAGSEQVSPTPQGHPTAEIERGCPLRWVPPGIRPGLSAARDAVGAIAGAWLERGLADDAIQSCGVPEKVDHIRPSALDELKLIEDVTLVAEEL